MQIRINTYAEVPKLAFVLGLSGSPVHVKGGFSSPFAELDTGRKSKYIVTEASLIKHNGEKSSIVSTSEINSDDIKNLVQYLQRNGIEFNILGLPQSTNFEIESKPVNLGGTSNTFLGQMDLGALEKFLEQNNRVQ